MKGAHIDFVVNDVTEGMLETAGEDLVFELDGNELALRVIGFFIARHGGLRRGMAVVIDGNPSLYLFCRQDQRWGMRE
jgi:hypothetical protein